MTSSNDIEKLFRQFDGNANAYQEINRENEARSARICWPLLVTLDLTRPAIPALGQRHEPTAAARPNHAPGPATDQQNATPKDATSDTRTKAPLFARAHRRDIPPVVAVAQRIGPRGAGRFAEHENDATLPAETSMAPADVAEPEITLAEPVASVPRACAPAAVAAASPVPIPGELLAPTSEAASQRPIDGSSESAPLQSVFDRLRGTPAQTQIQMAPAPARAASVAAPAPSNSWLINGPRRS